MIIPPVSGEPIASPWGIAVSNLLNSRPHALLRNLAAQSTPNNVGTLNLVTFTAASVLEDTGPFFDDATDALKVPAGMAGLYRIGFYMEFVPNTTGQRRYSLRISNTHVHQHITTPAIAQVCGYGATSMYRLADGDFVQVMASQNSGAALNIGIAEMQIERIGE